MVIDLRAPRRCVAVFGLTLVDASCSSGSTAGCRQTGFPSTYVHGYIRRFDSPPFRAGVADLGTSYVGVVTGGGAAAIASFPLVAAVPPPVSAGSKHHRRRVFSEAHSIGLLYVD